MSRITLSKAALASNLSSISKKAPLEKIYAVLKDNAYGHGLLEFGSLCASFGVRGAIVRDAKEALVVADFFESTLCLAETSDFNAPKNVSFAINSMKALQNIPQNIGVHIKVDSGMHRNGVDPSNIIEALELAVSKKIKVLGVFSHLRAADELSTESFWQEKNFLQIKREVISFCRSRGIDTPLFHLQNSAGLFRSGSLTEFDLARVGIALYGYLDMPQPFGELGLTPVLSLWADKISQRELMIGQRIGYGGKGVLGQGGVASIYDVGYADGLYRAEAEGEYILPNGKRLLGRVSMDNICVEGSDESVCVFDDATKLARRFKTISYDILVKLSPSIKRVVTE